MGATRVAVMRPGFCIICVDFRPDDRAAMIETVPGALNVEEVLADDPFYRVLGRLLARPGVLGFVLFVLVIAIIVFGPSSESRFIYTDF